MLILMVMKRANILIQANVSYRGCSGTLFFKLGIDFCTYISYYLCTDIIKVVMNVSPRTGRPTDDPKTKRVEIRLSSLDAEKLEYCCDTLNLSKAEVIRDGINNIYQKALELSKK